MGQIMTDFYKGSKIVPYFQCPPGAGVLPRLTPPPPGPAPAGPLPRRGRGQKKSAGAVPRRGRGLKILAGAGPRRGRGQNN